VKTRSRFCTGRAVVSTRERDDVARVAAQNTVALLWRRRWWRPVSYNTVKTRASAVDVFGLKHARSAWRTAAGVAAGPPMTTATRRENKKNIKKQQRPEHGNNTKSTRGLLTNTGPDGLLFLRASRLRVEIRLDEGRDGGTREEGAGARVRWRHVFIVNVHSTVVCPVNVIAKRFFRTRFKNARYSFSGRGVYRNSKLSTRFL